MSDRRRPAVAGTFYPADPRELRAVVEEMLGEVQAPSESAHGAIVPHAGLVYSGRCAAQVWGRLAIPQVVVILAPNHTGLASNTGGASAWSRGAFETPLGTVPIAEEFLAAVELRSPLVRHDPLAHQREHAIEVELPFLQVLAPNSRVAPIVLAWDRWEPAADVAEALADTVSEWSDDVLLVASSDMTHYESADAAEAKDQRALEAVEKLDGKELLARCRAENITMCGRAPSAVVIDAGRRLGATTGRVVDYRNSGWVTGDESAVVAYAGVVIS